MKRQYDINKIAIYFCLIVATIITVFPWVWVLLTSLKEPVIAYRRPPVFLFQPTLESYKLLFSPETHMGLGVDITRFALNSLIVALSSVIVTVTFSILGAYAISRMRFRGNRMVSFLILGTRMLPPIGTTIPLFLALLWVGLIDTHFGLIIAYTAINLPLAVWMLRSFFLQIPRELDEAALIDGCSRLQMLFYIIIPILRPGIAATTVFNFLWAWNDFPLALVLTNRNAKTLPLSIMAFVTEEGTMWGPMAAAITLMLIPAIIFVAITQKHIARGLTMGAVKG